MCKMYYRMLFWSILQYFWPALIDNRPWKQFFVFFLSGRLGQVLLYVCFSWCLSRYWLWLCLSYFFLLLTGIPLSRKCRLLVTSAAYIPIAHQTILITETNTMNPDQTATKGAVWSCPYCLHCRSQNKKTTQRERERERADKSCRE